MLLVLSQGPAQTPDPRLDVRASLEAPRLTYGEVGAWVQQKTKVPVYVVPAIRERKATILVEDRPVKEIMDRISEALFVEWERTKGGYTMRVPAKIQAEEAAMASLEPMAAQDTLRWKLNQMAQLGRKSKDSLKLELDDLNAQYKEIAKDTTPGAAERRADLSDRIGLLNNAYYSGYSRGMSIFTAQIPPAAQAGVLDGRTVYGSAQPRPGFLILPGEAIDAMKENSPMLSRDQKVLYSVHYLPATQEVNFSYGTVQENGASGGSLTIQGREGARYRFAMSQAALGKRLKEWAVTEPAAMETPLKPKKEVPEGRHQTTYKTLSDVLVELHERTGLPIVADGYRPALVSKRLPDGATVQKWNQSLGQWSDGRYRGYRPLVRTGSGWLMMRHPQYWQRIINEVPEGPIRRLEAACVQPGKATLDDFARFASAVAPAQDPYVGADQLVMEAPSAAIEGKLNILRLWAVLPPVLRQNATSNSGLELAPLQPNQQRLAIACLNERAGSVFGSEKELPYILPGGLPWPKDIRLFANLNAPTMNMEYQEYIEDDPNNNNLHSWNSMTDSVAGVNLRIGTPDGLSLQSYSIPLRPSRKIWPD